MRNPFCFYSILSVLNYTQAHNPSILACYCISKEIQVSSQISRASGQGGLQNISLFIWNWICESGSKNQEDTHNKYYCVSDLHCLFVNAFSSHDITQTDYVVNTSMEIRIYRTATEQRERRERDRAGEWENGSILLSLRGYIRITT